MKFLEREDNGFGIFGGFGGKKIGGNGGIFKEKGGQIFPVFSHSSIRGRES